MQLVFESQRFTISRRRHDPGHGACDAGELVLGKYDRTDAVK